MSRPTGIGGPAEAERSACVDPELDPLTVFCRDGKPTGSTRRCLAGSGTESTDGAHLNPVTWSIMNQLTLFCANRCRVSAWLSCHATCHSAETGAGNDQTAKRARTLSLPLNRLSNHGAPSLPAGALLSVPATPRTAFDAFKT